MHFSLVLEVEEQARTDLSIDLHAGSIYGTPEAMWLQPQNHCRAQPKMPEKQSRRLIMFLEYLSTPSNPLHHH